MLRASGRFEEAGILVEGDRIAAVPGPADSRQIAARDDVDTVKLRRGFLVPGFVDAHFHLVAGALKQWRCDLGSARSIEDVGALLETYAAKHPGETPVVGVDWDESDWEDASFPARALLDGISTIRPVFARRICGHVGAVNSVLLKELGAHGAFVNTDTGVITERAVARATELTRPAPSHVEEGIETAIRHLHTLGVTGIHDIIEENNVEAYAAGLRRSRVPLRIDGFFHVPPERFADLGARMRDCGMSDFRPAGIKVYLDGSIGARTAALHTPYEDDPTTGTLLVEPGSLRETLRSSADRGISCAVHAIGDRAVATALGEMQAVGDGRFRIEHAEIIGPAEMELVRGTSVALVMQPNFVRNWAGENGLYHRRLGGERWRRNNPFRSLVEAGVRIAFGSDGMPPGPLYGIRGATHHPNAAESISAAVALELYTDAPMRVGAHPGRPAGRLEPEALCDMVHLSANPLLGDLDGIQILGTWVGGKHVYPDDG